MAKGGSKKMKTSTKVLLGTGAVAAVGGFLLWNKYKADLKDDLMHGDSAASFRIVRVSPTVLKAQVLKAKSSGLSTMTPGLKAIEPFGWFGYLLGHGGACLAFTYKYMQQHKHILPDMAASWSHGKVSVDRSMDSLLINRFSEWPCPAIIWGGPRFLGPSIYDPFMGVRRGDFRTAMTNFHSDDVKMAGDPGKQNYLHYQRLYGGIRMDLDSWDDHWTGAKVVIDSSGKCFVRWHEVTGSGGGVGHIGPTQNFPVRPAANTMKYVAALMGEDTEIHLPLVESFVVHPRTQGKQLGGTLLRLVPNATRQLVCPPFWCATGARQARWWRRIVYWYYNAAWLVWCAEMVRLHCSATRILPAPTWWRDHCVSWGIGVPEVAQVIMRGTYADKDAEPGLAIKDLAADWVWPVLKLVVGYTPPPGTKGATGEQIVPDTLTSKDTAQFKRHLLDMPPEAGAVVPPTNLDFWAESTISYWSQHTSKFLPWTTLGPTIVNGVIEAVASVVGGGTLSAVQDVLIDTLNVSTEIAGIIMKVATVVLGKLWEMVKAQDTHFDISTADVVGLVTDVVGAVGAGEGINLKEIPGELWDSLKTAGAKLEHFGDWSQFAGKLHDLQNTLCSVRDQYGWDYLDAAYGGLGLSKNALSLGK
jgi:hypothetical protein